MPPRSWTIKGILEVTTAYLKQKGVQSPRLDAEVLLAHLMNCRRLDLYLRFDQPLSEEELAGYRSLVRRRAGREPLQYIRGRQEFWCLDFEVDSGVLIPRPETEVLVEQALALFRQGSIPGKDMPRVLDVGTGCGILAVCMAREISGAGIWASDTSPYALALAGRNARTHGVLERIEFLRGDLLTPFREGRANFDLILSNPPYVDSKALDGLEPEVRDHEPRQALDGGPGGMEFVRRILLDAPAFLSPGGRLLMEMDSAQMNEAMETAEAVGAYESQESIQDYTRRPRVLSLSRKRSSL